MTLGFQIFAGIQAGGIFEGEKSDRFLQGLGQIAHIIYGLRDSTLKRFFLRVKAKKSSKIAAVALARRTNLSKLIKHPFL